MDYVSALFAVPIKKLLSIRVCETLQHFVLVTQLVTDFNCIFIWSQHMNEMLRNFDQMVDGMIS